jgi:hypothetical protein
VNFPEKSKTIEAIKGTRIPEIFNPLSIMQSLTEEFFQEPFIEEILSILGFRIFGILTGFYLLTQTINALDNLRRIAGENILLVSEMNFFLD